MAAVIRYSLLRHLSTSSARATAVRVQGPSAVSGGHEGGYKMWKNISLFVAMPVIGLVMANCIMAHNAHEHGHPEFVKYEYLRRRTKRFPWGDGNHSLFHNPHTNALPDGYEE